MGAILLAVGVPIVYLFAGLFHLRPNLIVIANPRREIALATWMIVAATVVAAAWRTFVAIVYIPAFQLGNHFLNGGQKVDFYDVLAYLLAYTVMTPLLILGMRRTGQKLENIGISKTNLGRMLTFGLSLGSIYLFVAGSVNSLLLGMRFIGFSPTFFYGFVLFSIVGFGEETIWRGYIQTRLVARIGKPKGLLVTSLLFAILWHFPVSYYTQASGNVLGALAYASLRFFPGLLLGYVMIRSQNILPSSILHLFYDWSTILWR